MLPYFFGTVQENKLHIHNRAMLDKYIARFNGSEVQVTIGKKQRNRSENENRYYWGVVVNILADYCGYMPQEMHEALKWKFLRKTDGKLETVRSTASLSTNEFEEYLEKIRIWANTELSILIPLPNEVAFD